MIGEQDNSREFRMICLSYIPFVRCGATAKIIADDLFGGEASEIDLRRVRRALLSLGKDGVTVQVAPLPNGHPGGPWHEFWIGDRRSQRRAKDLTLNLLGHPDVKMEKMA